MSCTFPDLTFHNINIIKWNEEKNQIRWRTQNTRTTSLQLILTEGRVNDTQVCYLTHLFLSQKRANPESQDCPCSGQVQQNCSCPQLLKQECLNKDYICCSLLQKQVLIHFPEAVFPNSIHSFYKQLKIAAVQKEQTHTPPVCSSQKPAIPMKLSLPTIPCRAKGQLSLCARSVAEPADPRWVTLHQPEPQRGQARASTSKAKSREMTPRNLLCFQEERACSKQLGCF